MEGYQRFIGEMIGTAFLMFGGCMGGLTWNDQAPSSLVGAVCFGLVIMITVQCLGHISGTHLNPAVSVAAVVLGQISIPVSLNIVNFAATFLHEN